MTYHAYSRAGIDRAIVDKELFPTVDLLTSNEVTAGPSLCVR